MTLVLTPPAVIGLLIVIFMLLASEPRAHTLQVSLDAAKAHSELDINGRTLGLKFGAAMLGYQTEASDSVLIRAAAGRGYDPSVATTVLSNYASGSATCDIAQVEFTHTLISSGPWAIKPSIQYRHQRVNANLKGLKGDEPFRGTLDLRTHYLTSSVGVQWSGANGYTADARVGMQRWGLNFRAFGELDQVRIRTGSSVQGWGPSVAVGAGRPFGAFYVRLEAQGYRLDADNRVWVPGAAITLSGAPSR